MKVLEAISSASGNVAPFRVPESCCRPELRNCASVTKFESVEILKSTLARAEGLYQEGCVDKFEQWVEESWQWVVITGGVLIAVQLFALIFACVLCCAISRVGDK